MAGRPLIGWLTTGLPGARPGAAKGVSARR